MDKKFITAVIVCVVALTAVASGTYFIGQKGRDNVVNLREANNDATTAEENVKVAQDKIQETTEGDRVADDSTYRGSTEGETEIVANNQVVEANTESNVKEDEYMYGLSSEAAAQIKKLKFNKNSQLLYRYREIL